jgi:hypothetical protein
MTNTYWLERVVTKLHQALLSGKLLNRWVPDNEDPEAESRALDTLEIAGVIKSPGGFEGAPAPYQYRIVDLRAGFARSAPNREIVDFDYDKFLRFCEINNFNPTSGGVSAQLEIIDGVQPVIHIGESKYALESLNNSGTTQPIVAYAAKHPDRNIPIDELRAHITNTQLHKDTANIRQLFKKNVFGEKGLLKPFAEIGTKSFLLKKTALLTPDEITAVKKANTQH